MWSTDFGTNFNQATSLCGILILFHTDGVIFIETKSLEHVYAGYWRSVILVASSSLKRSPSNMFMRDTQALSYWWRHLHWNEIPRTCLCGILTLCHTDGIIFIETKSLEHIYAGCHTGGVIFIETKSLEHVYAGYSRSFKLVVSSSLKRNPSNIFGLVLRLCHTDGVIFIIVHVYAGYSSSLILMASSSLILKSKLS